MAGINLSGAHYNLNIIGVPKGKTADMTDSSGHRIFVKLDGNSKIYLSESTDGTFKVLDANGTDPSGAKFQLPAPGLYEIYARALGKPGGSSTLTTCAIDPVSGETICSTSSEVFVRSTGGSKFKNVTKNLTTIDIDPTLADALGLTCDGTVNIFDDCLEDYFWNYDNKGLKLLQLRFYEV
jgi:WD40 repeat protein